MPFPGVIAQSPLMKRKRLVGDKQRKKMDVRVRVAIPEGVAIPEVDEARPTLRKLHTFTSCTGPCVLCCAAQHAMQAAAAGWTYDYVTGTWCLN